MPHPCNYHVIGVGVPIDTTYVTSTQPLSLISIQSMSIKMKRTGAWSYTVFPVLSWCTTDGNVERVLGGAEFQSLQLFCSDLEQEECAYNNNRFKHYLHTVAQAKCIGILKFQLFSKQCYTQQLAWLNPHVCTN